MCHGVGFTVVLVWIYRFLLLLVELVNAQVMLQGIETNGCTIAAAGKAKILSKLHNPTLNRGGELLNKKTWLGKAENLQVSNSQKRKIRRDLDHTLMFLPFLMKAIPQWVSVSAEGN